MATKLPTIVKELVNEVKPGSLDWVPQSAEEWIAVEKSKVFLDVWKGQQNQERGLREKYAHWVFVLISIQLVVVFGLVIFIGLKWLDFDDNIIEILIPSVISEIFGMGFLVVKYLFSKPSRSISDFIKDSKEV